MKVSRTLPALLLALLATPAYAQFGTVTGVVKDQAGHAIKGATIVAESRDYPSPDTATSDKKGRFAVIGLRPGEWIFNVQAPGYELARLQMPVRALARNPGMQVRLVRAVLSPSLGGLTGREIQQRIDEAEAAATRGDVDGAIAAYTDIVAKVPGLTSVYLRLGALNERRHDTPAAIAAYRRLLEVEPANAKALAAVKRLTEGRR